MAEGGFDDYEMKEREQEQEQEREREIMEEQEQETNVDDIDLNNVFIRPDQRETNTRVNLDDIPNVKKDIWAIKRSITSDVKKAFKNIFNLSIEKKNGPNSTTILDYTKFVSEKSGKVFIEFKGERIGRVGKNLEPGLFIRKNKKFVDKFRLKLSGAVKEYEGTPSVLIQDLPEDVVEDILDSSIKRIDRKLDETAANMPEQDLREFAGIFDPKGATAEDKITALEVQADHWKNEMEKAVDAKTKRLYKSLETTARLQADNIRLKNNEKPIHEETIEIINDEISISDLGRLEKFKKWAKENLVGLSAIAITIAEIVTTVVIAGRKTVKQAANATGKLAKALVNVGKKLGPLIAPVLNLLAQAISWGAKGIEFLAKNLWLIAVTFAWFAYNEYKKKK